MRETQRSLVCSAQLGGKIFLSVYFHHHTIVLIKTLGRSSSCCFFIVLYSKVTPCACTTWKTFARPSTDPSPTGKNPTTTGVCTRVESPSLDPDLWVLASVCNSAMCRNLIVLSEPQNVTACFTHAFVPRHIVSFGSPPSLNVGSHFIRLTNLMSLFSAWLCTRLFCSSVSRRSIHVNVWNWAFVPVRLNRGFKWLRSDLFSLCLICADECPSVAEDKKVRLASSSYSRNSQVFFGFVPCVPVWLFLEEVS